MRTLGLAGLSVTMPHKHDVIAALDRLTPDAERARRRQLHRLGGRRAGRPQHRRRRPARSLRHDHGLEPDGLACVVVGAGGAARSVVRALAEAGAAEVAVVNRTARAGRGGRRAGRPRRPGRAPRPTSPPPTWSSTPPRSGWAPAPDDVADARRSRRPPAAGRPDRGRPGVPAAADPAAGPRRGRGRPAGRRARDARAPGGAGGRALDRASSPTSPPWTPPPASRRPTILQFPEGGRWIEDTLPRPSLRRMPWPCRVISSSFALPDVLRLLAGTGKSGRLEVVGAEGTGELVSRTAASPPRLVTRRRTPPDPPTWSSTSSASRTAPSASTRAT